VKQTIKRLLKLTVGWTFIILGILGLFLPVLQGILFLLIGLILISSEYVWARNLLEKLEARFPKIAAHSHEAHVKVEAWLHRHFAHHGSETPKDPQ
jgi:uncharacterized membrane protein YbaN (DUF454 family)